MSTVVLNAYSKGYPQIANRIRAAVYRQSDPQAFIAQIIDSNPGHPQRIWSFPGLPRTNYAFSLDEIDSSGNAVANLALFDVVPGEIDGLLTRPDEQIKVGTTPGFNTGDNQFIFDGTNNKPNYIGWEIVPSELTGRGILVKGLDYSWDSATATFKLLLVNDVFSADTYYNIHFDDGINPAGNSVSTVNDFEVKFITDTITIDASYFGCKVIVTPNGQYIEVTLPLAATIPVGRKLMVEIADGPTSSVKFKGNTGEIIFFGHGTVIAMPGESFSLYKCINNGVVQIRMCDENGNFRTVGKIVHFDDLPSGLKINAVRTNGDDGDIFQHARIYEYLSNLPSIQLVDYDSWTLPVSISTNGDVTWTKFSRANSSNPSKLNKFKFPFRLGLYKRNTLLLPAGSYINQDVGTHIHAIDTGNNGSDGIANAQTVRKTPTDSSENQGTQLNYTAIQPNTGTETRPVSYYANEYILL